MKGPKILYILNVAARVNNFSYSAMLAAQAEGMEFHIAGNWSYASDAERLSDEERYGIKIHQIDFIRAPYHPGNRKAYGQLKALMESENYDMIHCNTPIGGLLGRLAGKKYGIEKVIYQVHGFHFYKGAPLANWLLYYPVERLLAHWTDAIITINHEDYAFAQKKMKLRKDGRGYYVPGVGIDTQAYMPDETVRIAKRLELGLSGDDIMLISAGELNKNKNNMVLISALAKLQDKKIHYFLCGVGDKENDLRKQAEEAGLSENIHFLGYRTDMKALLQAADVFVMPSFREGLSRAIMEAMSSGLPCVVSRIRGNVDLVEEGKGGYLHAPADANAAAEAIAKLASDPALRQTMRAFNLEKIKNFDSSVVEQSIRAIYEDVFRHVRSENREGVAPAAK